MDLEDRNHELSVAFPLIRRTLHRSRHFVGLFLVTIGLNLEYQALRGLALSVLLGQLLQVRESTTDRLPRAAVQRERSAASTTVTQYSILDTASETGQRGVS